MFTGVGNKLTITITIDSVTCPVTSCQSVHSSFVHRKYSSMLGVNDYLQERFTRT